MLSFPQIGKNDTPLCYLKFVHLQKIYIGIKWYIDPVCSWKRVSTSKKLLLHE